MISVQTVIQNVQEVISKSDREILDPPDIATLFVNWYSNAMYNEHFTESNQDKFTKLSKLVIYKKRCLTVPFTFTSMPWCPHLVAIGWPISTVSIKGRLQCRSLKFYKYLMRFFIPLFPLSFIILYSFFLVMLLL